MKNKLKRYVLVFTYLMLALISIHFTSFAQDEPNFSGELTYPLIIAGQQVSSQNNSAILGDDKISYDASVSPAVLRLNGATVNGTISSTAPLKIIFSGANSVSMPTGIAIDSTDAIIFEGDGTLSVSGYTGIKSSGHVHINSGEVTANATSTGIGVHIEYNSTNPRINVSGGSLSVKSDAGSGVHSAVYLTGGSLDIQSVSGSAVFGSITATNATVSATSQSASYAVNGSVSVQTGGEVTITNTGLGHGISTGTTVNGGKLFAKSDNGIALVGAFSFVEGGAEIWGKTSAMSSTISVPEEASVFVGESNISNAELENHKADFTYHTVNPYVKINLDSTTGSSLIPSSSLSSSSLISSSSLSSSSLSPSSLISSSSLSSSSLSSSSLVSSSSSSSSSSTAIVVPPVTSSSTTSPIVTSSSSETTTPPTTETEDEESSSDSNEDSSQDISDNIPSISTPVGSDGGGDNSQGGITSGTTDNDPGPGITIPLPGTTQPLGVTIDGQPVDPEHIEQGESSITILPDAFIPFGDGEVTVEVMTEEGVLANKVIVENGIPTTTSANYGWSLFDLLITVFTFLAMSVYIFVKRRTNMQEGTQQVYHIGDGEVVGIHQKRSRRGKRVITAKVLAVLIFFASLILLLLTQDFRMPMMFFDFYSIYFAILGVVSFVLGFIVYKNTGAKPKKLIRYHRLYRTTNAVSHR